MKISVVTVSYNQGAFVEKTIQSVLNQDYDDFEYIVVDPGSTDGSRETIMKYSSQIDKIIFEPDNGPADGLNKGFARATGELFYYLNSDDIVLPGAFKRVGNFFKKQDKVDVIYGHGFLINAQGQIQRRIFSRKWRLESSFYVTNVLQQSTFFRRRSFERAGGFNVLNTTCWDYELLVDISFLNRDSCFILLSSGHTKVTRIIQALSILKDRQLNVPTCVFCGRDAGNLSLVQHAITKAALEEIIRLPGFVPNGHMSVLYKNALVLVMPTYFGPTNLPPLEATANAVPVIYSQHLQEQCGPAGIYFDIDDAGSLTEAIEKVLMNVDRELWRQASQKRLKEIQEEILLGEEMLHQALESYERKRQCFIGTY